MSFRYTRAVRAVKSITAVEQHMLFFLADMADNDGCCFPSQQFIAAGTFMGERTVRRTLRSLEKKGLIRRTKKSSQDGRQSDVISLYLDL